MDKHAVDIKQDAGAGVTLGLNARQLTDAFGIAGSFASGIGEFLTEGAWTKRLHPGWAAQSGYRAALLGRSGYFGPRTVFEGPRNVFRVFSGGAHASYEPLLDGLRRNWLMEDIAFKPYACGTMIHPFIDCMLQLRKTGIQADGIESIRSFTGAGLVDRLWEPLAAKQQPISGYAAKFSMPFCMAMAFLEGDAGLSQFANARVRDPAAIKLAQKISYEIDPDNEYPRNYTGHIRVRLRTGAVQDYRQPHLRGGIREPLSRDELIDKFHRNIAYGKASAAFGEALLVFVLSIAEQGDMTDMGKLRKLANSG